MDTRPELGLTHDEVWERLAEAIPVPALVTPEICTGHPISVIGEAGKRELVARFCDDANKMQIAITLPLPHAETEDEARAVITTALEQGREIASRKALAGWN